MQKIDKIFTIATKRMDDIGGIIILPMIFFVVIVDVVLRYIFNDPFIWSLEFNTWMLLLIFIFALPECTRQNGHIRMELVVSNLSPRLQMICDFAYVGCALWLIFLLGRAAWHELLLDYDLNRVTEYVQLPNWLHDILILAMCAVLIFYYIMRLIASILGSSAFSRSESAGMED